MRFFDLNFLVFFVLGIYKSICYVMRDLIIRLRSVLVS